MSEVKKSLTSAEALKMAKQSEADGNLEEAAKNLFSALRQLDAMPVEVVLAELVPDEGIGRAINDRLRRAAAQNHE